MSLKKWLKKLLEGEESSKKDKEELEGEPNREERSFQRLNTVSIQKESEDEKVYSPSVQHPILSIQESISRLEELYRRIEDNTRIIEENMATQKDAKEIKSSLDEERDYEKELGEKIDNLGKKIETLKRERDEITEEIEESKSKMTRKMGELTKVDKKIELLEADRRIIKALSESSMSTIELSEDLDYTRQYIWERLKELKENEIVKSEKKGRKTKYSLEVDPEEIL